MKSWPEDFNYSKSIINTGVCYNKLLFITNEVLQELSFFLINNLQNRWDTNFPATIVTYTVTIAHTCNRPCCKSSTYNIFYIQVGVLSLSKCSLIFILLGLVPSTIYSRIIPIIHQDLTRLLEDVKTCIRRYLFFFSLRTDSVYTHFWGQRCEHKGNQGASDTPSNLHY